MKNDMQNNPSRYNLPKLNQTNKDQLFTNGIIGEAIPFYSYSPNKKKNQQIFIKQIKSPPLQDPSLFLYSTKKSKNNFYFKYQNHRNRIFSFEKYMKKHNPLFNPQEVLSKQEKQESFMNFTSNPIKIVSEIQKLNRSERLSKGKRMKKIEGSEPIFTKQLEQEQQDKFISFQACKDRCYATKTNLIEYNYKKNTEKKKQFRKYKELKLNAKYKFVIGPGNNSEIIKQILSSRKNWIEASQNDSLYNFRWEQYCDKSVFKKVGFSNYKQIINHFQNHAVISSKAGLLKTLQKFCKRNSIQIFSIVPVSFTFNWDQYDQLEDQMKRFISYYVANHPFENFTLKKERQYIAIMKNVRQGHQSQNFSFEKTRISHYPQLSKIYKTSGNQNQNIYLWIIKPSNCNRGEGIKIFNSLPDLIAIIKNWREKKIFGDQFIIQKYIQKPLLINSRKFDIRVWMLFDNELNAYFFQEGYVRTSSQQFKISAQTIGDQFIHLTNNAVQKNNPNYGIFQEGNQISFDDIDEYLDFQTSFRGQVVSKIKTVCSIITEASKKSLESSSSRNSFEIFGLDFMMDENKDLWLIQVNTNPCIQLSSPLLKQVIPRMLDDAFKIVLDKVFKPALTKKKYPINGYDDDQNLWQKIQPFQKEKVTDSFQFNNYSL